MAPPNVKTADTTVPSDPAIHELPRRTIVLFSLACGATIANIYYSQSLLGPIAADLHVAAAVVGSIVMATQAGYGAGIFFLASLADLVENRRLVLLASVALVFALIGVATSSSAAALLASSALVGLTAVGTQVLLPLASHFTPEARRGRVIGDMMGGLITGIMLARPMASLLAQHFGWRAIFWVSAALMALTAAMLWRVVPHHQPRGNLRYTALLRSTLKLLATSRPLQRRAAYQGILFAVFNIFWTAAPLMLRDRFHFTQQDIAVFAFAGAGGALAAPVLGRLADRGFTPVATLCCMLLVITAAAASDWAVAIGSVAILLLAAIALDAAAQGNQIISQRVIYGIDPAARGRLNAAYMTVVLLSGSLGSLLGGFVYARGGWLSTMIVAAALGCAALALFMTERRPGEPESARRA